jgi:hypothetical protein
MNHDVGSVDPVCSRAGSCFATESNIPAFGDEFPPLQQRAGLGVGENRLVARSDRALASVTACREAYDEHAAEYAQALDPTLGEVVERVAELATYRPGLRVACGRSVWR